MAELCLLVSMEYDFIALLVGKYWTCWDQVFWCLNFENLPFLLVPYKNLGILDTFVGLSKVVLKVSLALAFDKIAFNLFLFDLSDVDPSVFIGTEPGNAKDIILQKFVMLSFNTDGIKASAFLNSAFFIIFQSFGDSF